MALEPLLFTALAIYALMMIAVSYFVGRETDYEEFAIADRNVGFIPMVGSMGSAFRDGMGIAFWIGTATTVGYGGLWMAVGLFFVFLLFGIIAPHIRRMAKQRGYITLGQLLADVIGQKTRLMYSVIILVFAILFAVPQLWVIGHLLAGISDISMWQSILASTALVGIYLIAGGYASVTITDAIQFFIIVGLIALPLVLPIPAELLYDTDSFFDYPIGDAIGIIGSTAILPLFMGDFWQRLFSARNDAVARYSFFVLPVVFIILTLGLIFVGMAASTNIDISQASNAIFAIYEQRALPVWLLAFLGVAFISICMSTLDTQVYLFTSTLIKDVMKSELNDKFIPLSRIMMGIILVIAGITSFFVEDIIGFFLQSTSAASVGVPVVIAAALNLFHPDDRWRDDISIGIMTTGLLFWAGLFFGGYFEDMIYLALPPAVSIILMCIYLTTQEIRLRSTKNASQ